MKIAWLCPYPVPFLGDLLEWKIHRTGAHPCSWIINLSKALVQMPDVELHLLTLNPWISRTQVVKKDGMVIHIIKNGVPFLHKGWPAWFPLDTLSGYRMESVNLCRELRKISPDIVHAHGTEQGYAITAMRSGLPYLTSIQGIIEEFDKTDPCLHYKLMKPREKWAVRNSKYFTCRTHFDTGFVRKLNPVAKIFDIPEAMGFVFFGGQWDDPPENRVLHVGGGSSRKGLHELIEAMGAAVKQIPEASIDAVGSCSPDRQKFLEGKAQSAGVKIRFHGFRNATEIAALHRQCSLFVLCSSNENSPNTLAEAMVSGMPVVAYNVGGVSSMFVDGESGALIQPNDTEALASAIAELLSDKEKATKLGVAAAEFARTRNHPDHVAEETMAAYEFILRNERVKQ